MRKLVATGLAGLTALLAALGSTEHAAAQADFPNRTIKIVVPLPPGATADTMPRIVADKLKGLWGQPVVIENRPGAAQNLGAELVAKAEPDGYTLLATPPGPLVINQSLYARLSYSPAQFEAVSVLAQVPSVLVVGANSRFASVRDFVEAARALATPTPAILWRHILPNAMAPLLVQGTFIAAAAVLTEAVLSFLGLGLPADIPTWGNIMAEGRVQFSLYPGQVLWPALFLIPTVLAINLLGDGLRDVLDPKFAKRVG